MVISIISKGPYRIHFPRLYQWGDWIELTQTFLEYEQGLPSNRQSRIASLLNRELPPCIALYEAYKSGQVQCATALPILQQLDTQATPLTRQICRTINHAWRATPAQAQAWGFPLKQATGVLVQPRSRRDRLALLEAYVAQQERCSPEDRFVTPALMTVQPVRDALAIQMAAYQNGLQQRRASRAAGPEAFRQLSVSIRLAACTLMLLFFDNEISVEMQKWGFTLIERESGRIVPRQDQAVKPVEPEIGSGNNLTPLKIKL